MHIDGMNGTPGLRRVGGSAGGGANETNGGGTPQTGDIATSELAHVATVVVYKDDSGYGMKVSGDNPVYIQSVKEGGAAARAGLHPGDKIIKVDGVNVVQSMHNDVVKLIKSSTQVVLTVQQKPMSNSGLTTSLSASSRPVSLSSAAASALSPSGHITSLHRAATVPASTERITGPQPVDVSPSRTRAYLHAHKPSSNSAYFANSSARYYKLLHSTRSPLGISISRRSACVVEKKHASKRQIESVRVRTVQLMLEQEQSYVDKLRSELAKAESSSGHNVNTLTSLQNELSGAERRVRTLQEKLNTIITSPDHQLCSLVTNTCSSPTSYFVPSSTSSSSSDVPPPLPSRKSFSMHNFSSPPPLPPRPPSATATSEQESHLTPPTTSHGIPNSLSQGTNLCLDGHLNKQQQHQRTKSSPEQLGICKMSPADASKALIGFESMNDLSNATCGVNLQNSVTDFSEDTKVPHVSTPPGTPPPPYLIPSPNDVAAPSVITDSIPENLVINSPSSRATMLNDGSSPRSIPQVQQSIMSMEDDDMSDQEILDDHGPFKSLNRLWEHHAHLAVFINYVLSNSDPSSLLFYLITQYYMEGNAKEMRKWAYEIHSSFLVPDAPLRLNNVDEKVAREIDDVLLKESDKEEFLKIIFCKARARAKGELNEQLTDFQQKRTAGLGTLFGPSDVQLDASITDKARETKIIETYLLPLVTSLMENMEPTSEEVEKDPAAVRRLTTASGLATVLTKVFQVRPPVTTVPTFLAKDKSNIKAKLLTAKSRKLNLRGHHFNPHQYYTVTICNYCQLIIGGVGPQGYQCSDCSLNVHRHCVKVVEELCPGPVVKSKERGNDRISKLMDRMYQRKSTPSHQTHQSHFNRHNLHEIERIKREEEETYLTDGENGENFHHHNRGGNLSANSRSNSGINDRSRVSAFSGSTDHSDSMDVPSSREDIAELVQQNPPNKPKCSINRSESYKDRITSKRQIREKRKTSDPSLSKTKRVGFSDCEAVATTSTGALVGNSAGSSSNSSLSTRSLDSPSTSLEQVHPTVLNTSTSSWDSDVDVEPDPPDWSQGVSDEVLARLGNSEKKRQEVINELFHTERSHVRALKVLSQLFHKPLMESQLLPPDQIELLFSNLDEMLTIHSNFNQAMKKKKKENPCVGDIGDLLLDMFDGEAGTAFELAASTYCSRQQVALDALRDRRRKDPKLNSFLNEIEANTLCRRLQLKDHIPLGMLRLTKYPLLFEKIVKYSQECCEKERNDLVRSLERSKEILSRVNQAVREAEDYPRLAEIQRTIQRLANEKCDHPTIKEFRNIDITKRKLVYEGPLQWRVEKRAKLVDLHVVLLDDTIFLMQRQDEKYVLKLINTNLINSILSPIIKVSTVLVRTNAVDPNSLFLVNTSEKAAQIYELVANSPAEKELWIKHISEVAAPYQKSNRLHTPPAATENINTNVNNAVQQQPQQPASQPESTQQTKMKQNVKNPENSTTTEPQKKDKKSDKGEDENMFDEEDEEEDERGEFAEEPEEPEKEEEDQVDREKNDKTETPKPTQTNEPSSPTGIAEPLRLVTCTQCSLVDPIDVDVENRPIYVAERVLTPIESLRRKDEIIKQTLNEKQSLIANMLHIPQTEDNVENIDGAKTEKESLGLVLGAIEQVNQITTIMNSALCLSETEAVLASTRSTLNTNAAMNASCESPCCPQLRATRSHVLHQPVVPVATLQPIFQSLLVHLSQLLETVKSREEEREQLHKELTNTREQLHARDAAAQKFEITVDSTRSNQELDAQSSTESEGQSDKMNKEELKDVEQGPSSETEKVDGTKTKTTDGDGAG